MKGEVTLKLSEITPADVEKVGSKALNLAEMLRAGFPVPSGFCITASVYLDFIEHLDEEIESLLATIERGDEKASEEKAACLRRKIAEGELKEAVRSKIVESYRRFKREACPKGVVAVRSSALMEDLPGASFAGQGRSYLNICDDRDLVAAIKSCWASLWNRSAIRYRRDRGLAWAKPAMAVIVQRMIPTDVAGVAFSIDPLTGEEVIVIEASKGLGEAVTRGEVKPNAYRVDKRTIEVEFPAPVLKRVRDTRTPRRPLSLSQVKLLAEVVMELEELFGCPQDVEWGFWKGELFLFQSRPVTTNVKSYFTQIIPDDHHIWTSGFFNERFPQPVSPLGWSIVKELVEELAFLDPLRFMGVPNTDSIAITKLYRGHPFVNVEIFQMLYKVFPDFILPEDASRYFPGGDVSLRKMARFPRSLISPRFIISMLTSFLRDPCNWSPFHNHRKWEKFTAKHEEEMGRLQMYLKASSSTNLRPPTRKPRFDDALLWEAIEDAQRLNKELLSIHRWSLTHADLMYTLLRKIVALWADGGIETCARLVSGLPNRSLEVNLALQRLAARPEEDSLSDFLAKYGHRSFSLDIFHPTFAEEPSQVLRLIEAQGKAGLDIEGRVKESEETYYEVKEALSRGPLGWLKGFVFDKVLILARRYMMLREDQRFYWQKTLAAQRKLFLLVGENLTKEGVLRSREDVFFATKEEIGDYIKGKTSSFPSVLLRKAEFMSLQREYEVAPHLHYPYFLVGNRPLDEGASLKGRPVSPGISKGKVVIITTPEQFEKISQGDILVARGIDPGWTPIFSRIGGLIMESGGQLSHGSIVAREYGIPAVAGIPNVTKLLKDGQVVVLDGTSGRIARIT